MSHPLAPLAFEDYLIHQRMLGVGILKTSWLLGYRQKEPVMGILHAAFLHMHTDTVEKRYHYQCNVGNGNIQCQHSVAQMLLDSCYITMGWQVLITLCKVNTYFLTAIYQAAKKELYSL